MIKLFLLYFLVINILHSKIRWVYLSFSIETKKNSNFAKNEIAVLLLFILLLILLLYI